MSDGEKSGSKAARPAGRPCPICGKAGIAAFRPFCSARCQDVDLHRWFSGAYAIPAVEDPDPEEEAEPG